MVPRMPTADSLFPNSMAAIRAGHEYNGELELRAGNLRSPAGHALASGNEQRKSPTLRYTKC